MEAALVEKAEKRTFTSDKLDWVNALSADPRVSSEAFEVGFCIAQHVNQRTGKAILSVETIRDKTHVNLRSVHRCRMHLKELGWIDWVRTKTANVYVTLGLNMNAVLDHQLVLKEQRDERRQKSRKQEVPEMAHLNQPDVPVPADREVPKVA